ncbi:hypothetical protein BESB_055530 [Besnoitia besnoiti]|uniref:E2F-associated phosphoprotein n=1 Tax=Besnoitia besnoiti TaxID=94643 RepID=A0A2A9MKF9_BESBE|nr:hypothetical protein BESB_055530 [Besnoitia besnoiti]PFH35902.1 hypothetical protein BESB_055530 [Besnoitia besnoiti]
MERSNPLLQFLPTSSPPTEAWSLEGAPQGEGRNLFSSADRGPLSRLAQPGVSPSASSASSSAAASSSLFAVDAEKVRSNSALRQLAEYLRSTRQTSDTSSSSSSSDAASSSPAGGAEALRLSEGVSQDWRLASRTVGGAEEDLFAHFSKRRGASAEPSEEPERALPRESDKREADEQPFFSCGLRLARTEEDEEMERRQNEFKKREDAAADPARQKRQPKLRPVLQPDPKEAAGGAPEEGHMEAEDEDEALDAELRRRLEKEIEEGGDFYDTSADDEDEKWVQKHLRVGDKATDAILCCPGCFTPVCYQCQRHDKFLLQYRAVSARNVVVDSFATVQPRAPEGATQKTSHARRPTGSPTARREAAADSEESEMVEKGEASQAEGDAQSDGREEELSVLKHLQQLSVGGSGKARAEGEDEDTDGDVVCAGLQGGKSAHRVKCANCGTVVALLDEEECYHFFHVLPGEA